MCGHVADGRAWMGLWADVNGCKQKEKRKGERKEKKEGLTMGSGHERAVQTLFEVFEVTSNIAKQGQIVRTLFECMETSANQEVPVQCWPALASVIVVIVRVHLWSAFIALSQSP